MLLFIGRYYTTTLWLLDMISRAIDYKCRFKQYINPYVNFLYTIGDHDGTPNKSIFTSMLIMLLGPSACVAG
jgi:hypothetical protein